jgi:hypothetical protein
MKWNHARVTMARVMAVTMTLAVTVYAMYVGRQGELKDVAIFSGSK